MVPVRSLLPDVDPFRCSSLDWHFPGGRVSVAEFLEQLQQATIDADAFFDEPLYVVSITDWPSGEALLKEPVTASGSARISL